MLQKNEKPESGKKAKVIIGVDIGLTGGIAVISALRNEQQVAEAYTMPVQDVSKEKKVKMAYNPAKIRELFVNFKEDFDIQDVVIEKTRAQWSGHNPQSSHKLGWGEGFFIGLCEGLDLVYLTVEPKAWQKQFGISGEKTTKTQSYEKAHELFPILELKGPRGGIKDGLCDALLLAEYSRVIFS